MNTILKLLLCMFLIFAKVLSYKLKLDEYQPHSVFYSVKLRTYLETEKSVLKDLEKPMWSVLNKKMIYRRYLEERKYDHEAAMVNVTRFLSNPINCFRLIKRLTVDLDYTKKIFRRYLVEFNWNQSVKYPTRRDLLEAAVSMARLMHLYALDPAELAEGIWRTNFSPDRRQFYERFQPMSASDCIELGKAMFQVNYQVYGIPWVRRGGKMLDPQTSMLDRRYENDEKPDQLIRTANLNLAKTAHEYAKWQDAFKEKCPDVDRNDPYHLQNTAYFLYRRNDVESTVKIIEDTALKNDTPRPLEHQPYYDFGDLEKYENLCCNRPSENVKKRKFRNSSKLCCFYLSKARPSLELVRIKVERLHYKPEILLFYDVITDLEVEIVRTETEPLLHDAFSKDEEFDFMIADLAWNSSSIVQRLSKRVVRLAGLEVDHVTVVNVIQYSVGGVFELHLDSWGEEARIQEDGNHLATFMFYVSDVEQGGATVFPSLGVSVFPTKGAALMWTNLLASGRPHSKTLHAGCPVLRGNKWVLTYRINLRGQEISRPCLLRNRTTLLRQNT